MSLNIDKTYYMIFRPRGKVLVEHDHICINGCKVSEVQTTKFLGVIIGNIISIIYAQRLPKILEFSNPVTVLKGIRY